MLIISPVTTILIISPVTTMLNFIQSFPRACPEGNDSRSELKTIEYNPMGI